MSKNIMIDVDIDNIGLRLDYIDKSYRDNIAYNLIEFVKTTWSINFVRVKYDEEYSSEFCQKYNLLSGRTKIAVISKNSYTVKETLPVTHHTLTVQFCGLLRYSEIDDKSLLLLKNIVAYLNTSDILFDIKQCDLCMDIKSKLEHILVVPVNRKSRKKYCLLGDYDQLGNRIQKHIGTYEIENIESVKNKANIVSFARLYDKRRKELKKANNDIGDDLVRYELVLKSRFFLDKEVSVNSFIQSLKDYKIFYFDDFKTKQRFINRYNKANSNKHKKQLIDKLSLTTPSYIPTMIKVGTFLRMLDTLKFDSKGGFVMDERENYIYGLSKFNKHKKTK